MDGGVVEPGAEGLEGVELGGLQGDRRRVRCRPGHLPPRERRGKARRGSAGCRGEASAWVEDGVAQGARRAPGSRRPLAGPQGRAGAQRPQGPVHQLRPRGWPLDRRLGRRAQGAQGGALGAGSRGEAADGAERGGGEEGVCGEGGAEVDAQRQGGFRRELRLGRQLTSVCVHARFSPGVSAISAGPHRCHGPKAGRGPLPSARPPGPGARACVSARGRTFAALAQTRLAGG
mmetsp:Transcript_3846/g.10552  ORF Transcript_3846/g.10552 Transcript_3846/m.10552 type:complete len:232 (-) Transcript_3846:6-701(-)